MQLTEIKWVLHVIFESQCLQADINKSYLGYQHSTHLQRRPKNDFHKHDISHIHNNTDN